MLDLMLGNGLGAFSCGEVYSWFRPWRSHHFRIDCSCGENPCSVWEKAGNVPERLFHGELARQLGLSFVVDSSKDLCWVIDNISWAQQSGLDVQNVLAWKHPLDLALSQWKRGKGPMSWRKEFVKYHNWFFSLGLPFVSVQQRSLAQNPGRKLSLICALIGMDYFDGKERFWEGISHHLFGSAGVREQVRRGVSEILPPGQFPPEFDRLIPDISRRTREDGEVQRILGVLESTEVDNWGDRELPASPPLAKKPWWYFARRARRAIKHYLPDPWPESP